MCDELGTVFSFCLSLDSGNVESHPSNKLPPENNNKLCLEHLQ